MILVLALCMLVYLPRIVGYLQSLLVGEPEIQKFEKSGRKVAEF